MQDYKHLDHRSQIYLRPDTYIGSIIPDERKMLIMNEDCSIIEESMIKYSPGLLRIFVEALSNAVDNKWRSDTAGVPMQAIKVNINKETGETSVWNDGLTIPVKKFLVKDSDGNVNKTVYIPELVFGILLTSSNYDDTQKRYTSGRNGLGIKATNIFSKQFKIRLFDTETHIFYEQLWEDNMKICHKPILKKVKNKISGFTEVSWIPDFEKFGLEGYTCDIIALFRKYTCDAAIIVSTYFMGIKIPVSDLKSYAHLYNKTEEMIRFKAEGSEVFLMSSIAGFSSISFVNGVMTEEGGTHVDVWTEAIFKPLLEKFKKKDSPVISIRDIKHFFRIIINCKIPNPSFGDQSKTRLATNKSLIMTNVNAKQINSIMKWNFVDKIHEIMRNKDLILMKKSTRKKRIVIADGYDPANECGGKFSKDCTLIVCEGKSAKTFAVSGIVTGFDGKSGRNWFGIYPLRGKPLNVRNKSSKKIVANKEITELIQILGLSYDKDYTNDKEFAKLNYGRVMILSDEDEDGLHIAGLIINMFVSLFPTLFDREECFLLRMQTPIIRIYFKGKTPSMSFYTQESFNKWREINNSKKITDVKWCKGLGSSEKEEARESFGRRVYDFTPNEGFEETLDLVFNVKRAEDRKNWLNKYNPSTIIVCDNDNEENYQERHISDFINYEMIRFSIDDCRRSLPNVMDGLKVSQRKVLHACFLKNLKYTGKAIKVFQLGGAVAEKTNYHHGDKSMNGTITAMGQDFIGSNNIPLLDRGGQFGTREDGGKKTAADARYIFTRLGRLTRLIFRPEDDDLLTYINDNGDMVEPEFFVPIIPMILVNGITAGIGTGWSSKVPAYNPLDVIEAVKLWIYNSSSNITFEGDSLVPWYRNFTGLIEPCGENKFITYGKIERIGNNKVKIIELPIGKWTENFREYLYQLQEDKLVSRVVNHSTDENIDFTITETEDFSCTIETLKLQTYLHTSNMICYTEKSLINKFYDVQEIIDYFCELRLQYYEKRREKIINDLSAKLLVMKNKCRFLEEVMDETLVIYRVDEVKINEDLEARKYEKIENSFKYLLDMNIRSFSQQKIDRLKQDIKSAEISLKEIQDKKASDIWLRDLDELSANIQE